THQGNLGVRKVYGRDAIRLLRCRTCGEEFSERRGTALVNTKVCKMTVARLLRVSGRHAERLHDPQVHDLTPRAVEFDEQWSYVKK
ncbi:transposase, partial [Candidatus Entotheonella serta]